MLLQEQASRTITTSSTVSVDIGLHLNALRHDSQRAAAAMQNPIARIGFERLIEAAISQVSNDLQEASSCCPKVSSQPLQPSQIQILHPPNPRKTVRRKCIFSTSSTLYGTLHIVSTVSEVINGNTDCAQELGGVEAGVEVQTVLSIHPSRWLLYCGLNFCIRITLSRSLQGTDCNFKSYRAVLDDALIFKLSENGETASIQSLFDEGKASPWDTKSRGLTPLFVSSPKSFYIS